MTFARQILNSINESITAYHGSSNFDIQKFNDRSTSINSHTFGDSEVTRRGIFFTSNPDLAKEYGVNVKKYNLNIHNTAKMTRDLVDEFAETLDPFGEEREMWIWARNIHYFWQAFDNELGERFVDWLIQDGYDSATFEEEMNDQEGQTFVVFDSSNVSVA